MVHGTVVHAWVHLIDWPNLAFSVGKPIVAVVQLDLALALLGVRLLGVVVHGIELFHESILWWFSDLKLIFLDLGDLLFLLESSQLLSLLLVDLRADIVDAGVHCLPFTEEFRVA